MWEHYPHTLKDMKVLRSFCMCFGGLVILSLLSSCNQCTRTILTNLGWSIENYKVHNIYSAVDMSFFHGFENKISLKDLQTTHGNPSRILNAKEFADIDGYNIWEYNVEQDKIDCYVKKNDSIVDYIYCEFANPRNIYSIVKDKNTANKIVADKAFADYIVDDFKTTIRILKQKGSKSHTVNIALDDNTDLIDSESLQTELEKINEEAPIPMADFCEISSWNYNNNVISINCDVNESPNGTTMNQLKNNSDFGKQCCIYFLGDKGLFSFLTPKILKNKAEVNLVFKGKSSGLTITSKIHTGKILNSPTTALQRLKAIVAYDNMGLVNLSSSAPHILKMGPREIRNNILHISMTYVTEPIDITDSQFKKFISQSFLNEENPDQEIILLCAQCGIGLCYINTYIKNGLQKTYTANFSNSDLKALRTLIK